MSDLPQARELATALVRVGTDAGKRVVALLTDMNAPLGNAVGNANETREALEVLSGVSPPDLLKCTLALGAEMLLLSGKARTKAEATQSLEQAISSGEARRVMERMVAAQGGDARVVLDPSRLEVAPPVALIAEQEGYVVDIDALEIGLVAVAMGAGRTRADQKIDPAVGLSIEAKPGTRVTRGQPLAQLHVRSPSDAARVASRVRSAFRIAEEAPPPRPLVLERVGA
jgi:pyrimidine-nucleoside phosphorylase